MIDLLVIANIYAAGYWIVTKNEKVLLTLCVAYATLALIGG